MEQKIIIIYANPWALTDEKTGQQRSGVSIQYINGEKLDPVNNENGSAGYSVLKESIPADKVNKLRAVPGVYTATMGLSARGGKNVLSVQDIDFVAAFGE